MKIWRLVEEQAALRPNAVMAHDETGRDLTFGQLKTDAEEVAAGLWDLGARPGHRVSWLLPSSIDTIVLMSALARLAVTQNPLLPLYRDREVGFITRQVRPSLFLTPTTWREYDYLGLVQRSVDSLDDPNSCRIVVCDGEFPHGDPSQLPAFSDADADGAEARWVLFTSGTTSEPKGALHSDETISAPSWSMADRLELVAEDIYPMIFSYAHVGGLCTYFESLMTGAQALMIERFEGDRTIEWLSRQGVTVATAGTTLLQSFLDYQRRHPGSKLFPQLRVGIAGQAPKPPQLHYEVKEELGGAGVMSAYGLTETPVATFTSLHDDDDALSLTEGSATTGVELVVVSESGSRCGPGEVGEIRMRGANVCLGYLDSKLNADAFDTDGFFRTGDLGKTDAKGNVTISGRIKDIIIRKGENIPAKEVEDVLYGHPQIAEVSVVGLPDVASGERACAVVVTALGQKPITFKELSEYCAAAGLARHMTPEQLEIVDELPRNATGKVLKRDLQARFGQ
jgi:cyclohexanecarboxylate-CoA ligase